MTQRLDAAGGEEGERRPEVEEPDPLVVRRRQPAQQAGAVVPDTLETLDVLEPGGPGRRDDRHYFSPSRYAVRARS